MFSRTTPFLFGLALLSSACSSKSSSSTQTGGLDANVDLSGTWAVRLTTTSVQGNCDFAFVNSVKPLLTVLEHDRVTGLLTIDADNPQDAFSEILNGATLGHSESVVEGNGDIRTFTLSLTFSREGKTVSGSGRERKTTSASQVLCDTSFTVDGEILENTLQFLLDWNTEDDIDLFAQEPDGTVIFFGNLTSPSGGRHSGDANESCVNNLIATEAITYPSPESGTFTATVSINNGCVVSDVDFALIIAKPGQDPITFEDTINPFTSFEEQVVIP